MRPDARLYWRFESFFLIYHRRQPREKKEREREKSRSRWGPRGEMERGRRKRKGKSWPAGRRLNVLNNGKIYQMTPTVFPQEHLSFRFYSSRPSSALTLCDIHIFVSVSLVRHFLLIHGSLIKLCPRSFPNAAKSRLSQRGMATIFSLRDLLTRDKGDSFTSYFVSVLFRRVIFDTVAPRRLTAGFSHKKCTTSFSCYYSNRDGWFVARVGRSPSDADARRDR